MTTTSSIRGGSGGNSDDVKEIRARKLTSAQVKELTPVLYLKAMTFHFNLGEGVKDSFEAKFA